MRKKIATITFHWGTNYGAVIQAYALQEFLTRMGFDVELINYVPAWISLYGKAIDIIHFNIKSLKKEHKLKKFRKKYLKLTSNVYFSFNDLKKCKGRYDAIICGSDQIWNISFTLHAEFRATLSYFLSFADSNTKKIAYAVSFGTDTVPEEYVEVTKEAVEQFELISVREESGIDILRKNYGIRAELVCDPTILLNRADYEMLIKNVDITAKKVFLYLLHENMQNTKLIANYITGLMNDVEIAKDEGKYELLEWLYMIKNAEFVLTDSFHGTVFAIIFNVPFIAISEDSIGMRNRITTLLSNLGLEDRLVTTFNSSSLDNIMNRTVKWDIVNLRLEQMRRKGNDFLIRALG